MCMDACADVCGAAGQSLGRLGAQQSLNSCVDVPTGGDERLQIGLTVDEAHGIQLLQLLLESHFGTLRLRGEGQTLESETAIQHGQCQQPVQQPQAQLQAHVGTVSMLPWVVAQQPHKCQSWLGTDSGSSAGRRIPSTLSLNLSKGSTPQRVRQIPTPNLA